MVLVRIVKNKNKKIEEYHHGNKGSGSVPNHGDENEENLEDPSFITEETICQIKSHGILIHAKISEINRSTKLDYVNIKTKIQKRQPFLIPYQCHNHGNCSIQDSLYKYQKRKKNQKILRNA